LRPRIGFPAMYEFGVCAREGGPHGIRGPEGSPKTFSAQRLPRGPILRKAPRRADLPVEQNEFELVVNISGRPRLWASLPRISRRLQTMGISEYENGVCTRICKNRGPERTRDHCVVCLRLIGPASRSKPGSRLVLGRQMLSAPNRSRAAGPPPFDRRCAHKGSFRAPVRRVQERKDQPALSSDWSDNVCMRLLSKKTGGPPPDRRYIIPFY